MENFEGGSSTFGLAESWGTRDEIKESYIAHNNTLIERDRIKSIRHHKLFGKRNFKFEVGKTVVMNKGYGDYEFIVSGIFKDDICYSIITDTGFIIRKVYYELYDKIEEVKY